MDEMSYAWPFLIPIVAILGAFIYLIVLTVSRARVRELEVRERIALIERGLVPPPEVDPRGFERVMGQYDRLRKHPPGRHRRAGVMLIGAGFGLMVLIGFAGESPSSAVGVGGFLVFLGIAFVINSRIDTRHQLAANPRSPAAAPLGPPDPPTQQ